MSAASKKQNSSAPALSVVDPTTQEVAGLYSTAPLGSGRHEPGSDGLPAHIKEFLDRAFTTLKTLTSSSDIFLMPVYPDRDARMEWATGHFGPHLSKVFSKDVEPIASFLKKPEPTIHPESTRIKNADPAFLSLPPGSLALVPLELSGDILTVVGYWQQNGRGRITTEKLQALRSFAEMIELALSATDLTQDVQTQQLRLDLMREEMEEVQLFYKHYAEAIRQCFWVLDLQLGRVVLASDNFDRVWGASETILDDGLTGFMQNVLPGDRDRVLSDFHTSLGHAFDTELRVIDKKGEIRWMWVRAFPTTEIGEGGVPAKLILIADDITEKKLQEEVLREREARVVDSAKSVAVGDLATGVAHEINNPLTIIVGRASELKRLAEQGKLTPETALELAEKIESTSIRISKIILSLKSLARQDVKQPKHVTPFKQLFKEIVDISTEKFKIGGVKLEIPEFPKDFSAELNPTLISQLLLNLVNNAFDALQNEKEKWVKVEYAEDDDSVFIYVTDSGPGIPIKIRSRIFDPFFTTKEPGKGTGLGLSLSVSIAQHHHGQLRLDNMHSHTRFVLQLPKRQPVQIKKSA